MAGFLLHITEEDTNYLSTVKSLVPAGTKVPLSNVVPSTVMELVLTAKQRGVSQIATTSPKLLNLLLDGKASAKMWYQGSIIEKFGMEFMPIAPLEQLYTIAHGKFLFKRYISKFTTPEKWWQIPQFTWELFEPKNAERLIDICEDATFISCDIETGDELEKVITCVGFTAVKISAGTITMTTFVVPFNDMFNYTFVKCICQCSTPKVFQNGQYDNDYLLRFGIPVYNYFADTLVLFHAWYAELPKRLDFLTSFLVRNWTYWKDESDTIDLMEYYRYNAKDCFVTALDFITLLRQMPDYAWHNFHMKMPIVFPSILAEMTGLRRDGEYYKAEEVRFNEKLKEQLAAVQAMVGCKFYNPNSPPQTARLFKALGSGDITATGKIERDKVAARHPINKRIMTAIKNYREDTKMAGTYLKDEVTTTKRDRDVGRTKSWHGRILFSIRPSFTDTGRGASQESSFWCGWQTQNFPRDRKDFSFRRGIIADPGFYIGECDRSQAEARDTAYLAGDVGLIAAVEDTTKDFHGLNAAAFFGIPYDRIVNSTWDSILEEWVHEAVDKVIRDLSKRTNHGANYNMGAQVLLDTMGIENVVKAAQVLKLPRNWSLLQVTQYLLDCYDKKYPGVRKGAWYEKIKNDVASTSMLVGPTGWTRYCFGDPSKSKQWMNAYAAHPPQSLNAMEMDYAYKRVFYEIAIPYSKDFKLGPQIHDSIFFQYRIGSVHLAWKVKQCMDNPIHVTDPFGINRLLRIPTDLKGEAVNWADTTPIRRYYETA